MSGSARSAVQEVAGDGAEEDVGRVADEGDPSREGRRQEIEEQPGQPLAGYPALLGKEPGTGPRAYVCVDRVCQLPTEDLATFIKQYGQRNISVASELVPDSGQ